MPSEASNNRGGSEGQALKSRPSNPFSALPRPHEQVVEREPNAEGMFTCSTRDCWQVVYEAYYDEENNKLSWQCPSGHMSEIDYHE